MRLSTVWLPGAVISLHAGICCSSCCTVALLPVVLLACIRLLVMELVKGVDDTAAPVRLQVQIDHRSADVAMAQQLFNGMQVGTGIKEVSSEGVPKGMSAKTLILKACLLHGNLHIELNAAGVHALTLFDSFKQISDRPVLTEVFAKSCQRK